MKINPIGNTGPVSSSYRTNKVSAYMNTQSTMRADEATLSDEAISFSKIFAEAREAASVREEDNAARIAELKQQVQDGTYSVDSGALADSILGDLFG